MKRHTLLALAVFSLIGGLSLPTLSQSAKNSQKPDGKQIYQQYCAKCHLSGGNQIKEKRPVAGSKELASIISFKNYLSLPPGHMPYYQNLVRNETAMKALYDYCLQLKKEPLRQASLPAAKP